MLYRRHVMGWISWPTVRRFRVGKATVQQPTFCLCIHTQKVIWKKSDEQDDVEHCQLLSFRPLDSSINEPLDAITANDSTSGSNALTHLSNGTALIFTGGDYRNALQVLQAVKRRCYTKLLKHNPVYQEIYDIKQEWMQQRQAQREQSDIVNRFLIQIGLNDRRPSEILGLKRTPENALDVLSFAFQNDHELTLHDDNNEVSGRSSLDFFLLSLNDFLGMTGGYEWYRQGININWIRDKIYPHFGVFPPTRQDYISLLKHVKVNKADQSPIRMLEVGIGTGVLSIALLLKERVDKVIGTDINPYAIACARDNVQRFGFSDKVDLVQADLFPPAESANDIQKFDVILFNPPWIPGDAATILDQAVYDSDQSILRRFLSEAQHHLNQDGEVYLMLSNLGMLVGLFEEKDLQQMFRDGNLEVAEVHGTLSKAKREEETPPKQKKKPKQQADDNITLLRTLEVISFYRLRSKAANETNNSQSS